MIGIEMLRNLAQHCRDASVNGYTTVVTAVHAAAIEAIADQLECEHDSMVADSQHDALPQEDRDAIAWVREHGGLDAVKDGWTEHVPLKNVKRMVELHKKKRDRLKAHALWLERKCHERRERIKELNGKAADQSNEIQVLRDAVFETCARLGITCSGNVVDDAQYAWREIARRLMPEGMEWLLEVWPKWSNGEYCKFGDWWKSDKYGEHEPNQFRKLSIYTPEKLREWGQDDGDHFGYEWDFMRPSDPKYRPDKVEPPAPKVLDADGAEIRVGDECYVASNGDGPYVVDYIREADGAIDMHWHENRNESLHIRPDLITLRAPVLAADGRPLREGETVWLTDGSERHVVLSTEKDAIGNIVTEVQAPGMIKVHISPSRLTHEHPVSDTWERLEEDARNIRTAMLDSDKLPFEVIDERALDIVRRAKKLAERGA